jgi:lipopolysaccharide transport system ATP-binding protein
MAPAIRVENLAKSYRITRAAERRGYKTLRESLVGLANRTISRAKGAAADSEEEFWALSDVSFEVNPGEVVGIIGRNGAGKSTLLKILSRITRPTTGSVELRGRIGSLLEVGTGFHPELSGRENIYLNGSILGMRREDIDSKFDAIVDFSGVSRFLDIPVKRYSSGMQVRLAFGVAAHLDPEILVIDEVLAVGDIDFQNKCLSRIQEVTHSGRTVLFVSHNMTAVQALCTRALMLKNGRISDSGTATEVVSRYLASVAAGSGAGQKSCVDLSRHPNRGGSSRPILEELRITSNGSPTVQVPVGASLTFEIRFALANDYPALSGVVFICRPDGQRVVMGHSRINSQVEITGVRQGVLRANFPEISLVPGSYRIDLAIVSSDEIFDYIEHAAEISLVASNFLGTGELPNDAQALVAERSNWECVPRV